MRSVLIRMITRRAIDDKWRRKWMIYLIYSFSWFLFSQWLSLVGEMDENSSARDSWIECPFDGVQVVDEEGGTRTFHFGASEQFAINSGHQSVSSFNCCNLLLFHLYTFCNYSRFEKLLAEQGWRRQEYGQVKAFEWGAIQPPTTDQSITDWGSSSCVVHRERLLVCRWLAVFLGDVSRTWTIAVWLVTGTTAGRRAKTFVIALFA